MDKETYVRKAYSWGGRFHLATEVESEFGKSLKTACDTLHNPATVKVTAMWGAVPLAYICRECLAHEDAPLAKTVEQTHGAGGGIALGGLIANDVASGDPEPPAGFNPAMWGTPSEQHKAAAEDVIGMPIITPDEDVKA